MSGLGEAIGSASVGSAASAGSAPAADPGVVAFLVLSVGPWLVLWGSIVIALSVLQRPTAPRSLAIVSPVAVLAFGQTIEVQAVLRGREAVAQVPIETIEAGGTVLVAGLLYVAVRAHTDDTGSVTETQPEPETQAQPEPETQAQTRDDEPSDSILKREQLTAIFDNIHDGVFIVDVDADEILEANDQATEMLGYDRPELLELGVSDVHPDEMDRIRELAERAEREGEVLASDLHCLRKDGRTIPIETAMSAARFRGRQCLVVIVRDISTRKRQDHYLKVFDRVLRHNLRNAMNVILGRAEYIGEQTDDEDLATLAQGLCETADELVRVAEDIRTVQRSIRSDTEEYTFDCVVALEEIIESLAREYPEATISADLPNVLLVQASDRLQVALEHVLENALEHHDRTHPNVEVLAAPVDQYDTVEIKIVDDGPGIPPEERLVADDPERTSPIEHGTGLGLWVSSMVVESFDGTFEIDDNQPRGTVVTICLPRAKETTTVSQTDDSA